MTAAATFGPSKKSDLLVFFYYKMYTHDLCSALRGRADARRRVLCSYTWFFKRKILNPVARTTRIGKHPLSISPSLHLSIPASSYSLLTLTPHSLSPSHFPFANGSAQKWQLIVGGQSFPMKLDFGTAAQPGTQQGHSPSCISSFFEPS